MEQDTKKTIDFIEKQYKQIEEEHNTTTALDYLQEICDYLKNKYKID